MLHLLPLLALLSVPASAAPSDPGPAWAQSLPVEQVVKWRRHLHKNPELSFKEWKTSDYVAAALKGLGNIEVRRPTATSVIGVLRGARPGRTVAFRADLDALPVQEETGLPYASVVKGVSHACGHDVHTALLLGAAATLSKMQKDLRGTIYFIFQHAEEQGPGGAQELVKAGALKGVEAVFGLHVIGGYPAGKIGILPSGPATTAADGFDLTIQGRGSHGAMPQLGVDPVVTGAQIVTALQTVVSRNVAPGEMAVVTVGKFQSGSASNVIPDKAELAGTVRTVTDATRQLAADRVKAIVDGITKANGATYTLDYKFIYPAVQNDAALVAQAKLSALEALGPELAADAPRLSGSEDFANYKAAAPICLFILGGGPGPANHSPKFNFDEAGLANGIKAEVQVLLDYLNHD